MIQTFPRYLELEIWHRASAYLRQCRVGDLEHTERSVDIGKQLADEKNDLFVLIPTLYCHDTGYAKAFLEFPELRQVTNATWPRLAELHMKYGADNSQQILDEINFAIMYGQGRTEKIVRIVRIHDTPKLVFEWGDADAVRTLESDRLDRYNIGRWDDLKKEFVKVDDQWRLEYMRRGLAEWFKTKRGSALAKERFDEMVAALKNRGDIK
jgi:hypothetical protein